ncbi:zinc finger, CCHC-type containing protein [Tanacetum coccineum]
MSFSKRQGNDVVCYTKPLDSLKSWNDRFFWVDAFACPASFSWNTSKSMSKDPFPKSSQYNAEHYATLVAYLAPFHKYPEPFLCLIGISRNYTLDEDTYLQFLCDKNEGGNGFALLYLNCRSYKGEDLCRNLIYIYLCDLNVIPSLENKKYFVTFIDDASRSLIKRFRTDRRDEYMDTLYFQSVGVIHELTAMTELKVMGKPNLNYLRVWGCKEVVRLPNPKLKTLGERGIECIFVGYVEHSKAFRFYVIEPNDSVSINSIIESKDAIFDKNRFSSVPRPSLRIPSGTEDIGGSVVPEEVTEEEQGMRFATSWLQMDLQKKTEVARISTIRLLIAMASIHNLIIHQMDVKTTFLNGDLEEEVYMNQPQGFIMPGNEKKVNPTKKFLSSKFSMKDMGGGGDVILRIRIKHGMLEGYIDASWISNTKENSSASGWVFLLGGGAISWASKKQTCITGSTMESEFVALVAAGKEAEWYNTIRELITNEVISIEFVRSQQNLADHLMKGLARDLVIKSLNARTPNSLLRKLGS